MTGYYELGWYTMGQIIKGYSASGIQQSMEVIFAATKMRFVNLGFDLSELTGYLDGVDLSRPFKAFRSLDSKRTLKLFNLLNNADDETEIYLKEIRRLEEENINKVGYAYPNWKGKKGLPGKKLGNILVWNESL